MKRILVNLCLVMISTAVAILAAEFASRLFMPVSPGARSLALDGQPLVVATAADNRLPRGLAYRQVSTEYDARVTITAMGHRAPAVAGNPDVVFIGDSFTFGWGLSDEETFVYRYCTEAHLDCANLGQGGTGTTDQVDILAEFLGTDGWRPARVKLFMLAMTGALMDGNDLADNLTRSRAEKAQTVANSALPSPEAPPDRWFSPLLGLRSRLLAVSNLARAVYFRFGPALRAALSPVPDEADVAEALRATNAPLERLRNLARTYGFEYAIYVLHPVQDLLRGTHTDTMAAIRTLAGAAAVRTTAQIFADDPVSYYYPYDGHLNARGSQAVAQFLLSEDRLRN